MPFGPKICASCGSKDGIEAHHLYPKVLGCPANLTVWLCNDCHGKAHCMMRRHDVPTLTKEAMRARKEAGLIVGMIPYGMRLAADGETLVPDAWELKTIEIARALRAQGFTLRAISGELKRMKRLSRARTPFQPNQVRRLVADPDPIWVSSLEALYPPGGTAVRDEAA